MKEKILKATNGGLNVILQYYPQAVDVLLVVLWMVWKVAKFVYLRR